MLRGTVRNSLGSAGRNTPETPDPKNCTAAIVDDLDAFRSDLSDLDKRLSRIRLGRAELGWDLCDDADQLLHHIAAGLRAASFSGVTIYLCPFRLRLLLALHNLFGINGASITAGARFCYKIRRIYFSR